MGFDLGDAQKTALVILDMQNDIVSERSEIARRLGFAEMVTRSGVVGNIRRLLDAFRAARLPVVHVVVDFTVSRQFQMPHRGQVFQAIASAGPMLAKGTWGGEIHEDLTPAAGEPVVPKAMFSAFGGTDLHQILRQRDVSQLILVGVATEFVVDATSWSASDLGYDVIIPRDGCSSANPEAHENALQRMAARADIVDVATLTEALRAPQHA
jgi:nicotinamidase-related amidase